MTQITQAEYEARNLSGFEGDSFFKEKMAKIIQQHKITVVCELGAYLGGTTNQLASMVKQVIATEINQDFFNRAVDFVKHHKNVTIYNADTVTVLPDILQRVKNKKIIVLIDDHWGALPLLDELRIIAESGIKPIIIIHDFVSPGHPELGYDSYNGKALSWDFIKESIIKIYGFDGFRIEYNSEATGAKRGIVFIYPK